MAKKIVSADIGLSKVKMLSKNKSSHKIAAREFCSTISQVDNWNEPLAEEEFLFKYNNHIYKIGGKATSDKTLSASDAERIHALAVAALSADSKKINNVIFTYLSQNELNLPHGRQSVFIKKYSHAPVERKEFKLLKTKRITPVVSSLSLVPNNMDIGCSTVDILTA